MTQITQMGQPRRERVKAGKVTYSEDEFFGGTTPVILSFREMARAVEESDLPRRWSQLALYCGVSSEIPSPHPNPLLREEREKNPTLSSERRGS